jgi:hypothetical protein
MQFTSLSAPRKRGFFVSKKGAGIRPSLTMPRLSRFYTPSFLTSSL